MAIQIRRGKYADFDPAKMVSGELAVVLEGDPNSSTGRSLYACFNPGIVKRIADYEDIIDLIDEATDDIRSEIKSDAASSQKAAADSASAASASQIAASKSEANAEASRKAAASSASDSADSAAAAKDYRDAAAGYAGAASYSFMVDSEGYLCLNYKEDKT